MRLTTAIAVVVGVAIARGAAFGVRRSDARASNSTTNPSHRTENLSAAAAYLEQRTAWWEAWPAAQRDHGTVCVSCHTTLPFALARSAIGGNVSPVERRLFESVTMRVRTWNGVAPYYASRPGDGRKAAESRGTEAVLNALILADRDAREGVLSSDARTAFDRMWELQQADGAWPWLRFDLNPWEGPESAYFGAALAALAVGSAPASYRSTPAIDAHARRLRSFLAANYARQPLANRAAALWAASKLPDAIDGERRAALTTELARAQRRDGGWSLEALQAPSLRTWFSASHGYATALAALALMPTEARDTAARGVAWLARNQDASCGCWRAPSLNATRDPRSDAAPFMTDAATGFAVLALKAGYVR
ncbi:MAG TPA: hypothetical protein VKH42_19540 [Vicinamibacterales bacterium]|nr:hypothetical protein [Vicinamibacterales bacterium]